jgi:hypothetical protein
MRCNNRFSTTERYAIRALATFVLISVSCTVACCQDMICVKDFCIDPQMLSLIKAAEKNDLTKLKRLVDDGAEAMYAANLNQFKIVYFLLNTGADHKHLTRGGVSLAEIVQDSSVNPEFEGYEIRKKVIKMLEERGVKFPVPSSEDLHTP